MTMRHLVLAACLAAFSPFVLIACGDVEDSPTPDVADSFDGADVGVDTPDVPSGADVGTPDAPIGADTSFDGHTEDTFYEELCEECLERGFIECPEFDRFLSWSEDKALPSVEDAADELCPEVPVVDICADAREALVEGGTYECGAAVCQLEFYEYEGECAVACSPAFNKYFEELSLHGDGTFDYTDSAGTFTCTQQ